MSIITNRLQIKFNLEKINDDFIFIRFDRGNNGKWWGAKELDLIIGDDYKAMSVCYTDKYAYAMFERKSNDVSKLEEKLRDDPNFDKVSAQKIPLDNFDQEYDESISKLELARLLLNSLGSSRSKFPSQHFSNLTGNLLKVPTLDQLYSSIQVAEVNLNYTNNQKKDFLLNVTIATYRTKLSILSALKTATGQDKEQLEKYLKRPQYIVYKGRNSLRRYLPSGEDKANAKEIYIKAGVKNKKAHQDFLDVSSLDDFHISRAGVLYQVIKDTEKYLSQYLTLQFIPMEIEQHLEFNPKEWMLNKPQNLHSILETQTIRIIDTVNNEDSHNLVDELQKMLKPYFQDQTAISVGTKEAKGSLNIRIIHDKKYYQKSKIKDEYKASDENYQRQNITIESVASVSTAIVKTLIKELIIKQDLNKKKLSLFDWSKVNPQDDWIFAMFGEEDDHKTQKLTFMTIHSDGSFAICDLDLWQNLDNNTKYYQYHNYIEQAITREKQTKSSFQFEGFIASESGDINLIFRSDEITLPKLEEIASIVKEVERELTEDQNNGLFFIDIVREFLAVNPKLDQKKFQLFCQRLQQYYQYRLSKKELYNLIQECLGSERKNENKKTKKITISYKANTVEATKFRDYLLEKYHIRFKFPQDNDSKDDLFYSALNIQYFGETETEAYYFVGDQRDKFQHSFKDACHIRKIIAVEGSRLIFQELLKTMDVDFVRTGQSTVIPFPFKYIREYQNLNLDH